MTLSAQDLYNQIVAYVKEQGGVASSWYAGITSDIESRLYSAHNVSRNGVWIWGQVTSATGARNVEAALLKLGMTGGTGGGDETSDCVYCYKITNSTVE